MVRFKGLTLCLISFVLGSSSIACSTKSVLPYLSPWEKRSKHFSSRSSTFSLSAFLARTGLLFSWNSSVSHRCFFLWLQELGHPTTSVCGFLLLSSLDSTSVLDFLATSWDSMSILGFLLTFLVANEGA